MSTFPPLERNVGRSRRMTRTALASWGASDLADSAELLVSELVTNAVRYGRGAVSVNLALTGSALHISVADFGAGLPTARDAADDDSNGRGLAIVTALCEQWTVTTRLTGKTVSCRLDLPL
ncbi:ATP-binding protein [Kitasatospora sp. NPDC057223]|jgi:two-component sensor histidine kinase|uniref:ATP-binding protein n=1 Tax=Kitasatospora sp. NPDC057223 TaxID=3346055 RepID=UPI0036362A8A